MNDTPGARPWLPLVLVGPMASGKTSVGQALAEALEATFVDLDHRVVAAHGPIPDIFVRLGEAGFRRFETQALLSALQEDESVISAGGGTILAEENREALRDSFVVFLDIDEATARRRLEGNTDRPLLAGGDPMREWVRIHEERLDLYRHVAALCVDARTRTPNEIAQEIAVAYAQAHRPTALETPRNK